MRRLIEVLMIIMGGLQIATGSKHDKHDDKRKASGIEVVQMSNNLDNPPPPPFYGYRDNPPRLAFP